MKTAETKESSAEFVEVAREHLPNIKDPLLRQDLDAVVSTMELQKRFKRIDISFLQMVCKIMEDPNLPNPNLPNNEVWAPRFAVLPYDIYKRNGSCYFNFSQYQWEIMDSTGGHTFNIPEVIQQQISRGMENKNKPSDRKQAKPPSEIPATVDAVVLEVKDKFDNFYVAWEADWLPEQKDPIVLGQRGKYWFVIASWDVTKFESYVMSEF